MALPLAVNWIIAIVGLGCSLFFGFRARSIFSVESPDKKDWRLYQFWFNFVGSMAGWVALWFSVGKAWPCLLSRCTGSLTISDALVLVIAFVGVTGHLPYAMDGVLRGLRELALKLAGPKG